MPTLCDYDCDVYWQDQTGNAFGAAPDNNWYELPDVQICNVTLREDRLNHKGLGSRTRIFKNLIKHDDTLSLDITLEESANSTWVMAQEVTPDFSETTPCQIGIVVRVDTDRDGAMDTWIYAYGNILNTITITGKVNDVTMVKADFLTQYLSVVVAEVGVPVYNTVATPVVEDFTAISVVKGDDGVTGYHNEIDDVTVVDATDQGADLAITAESSAAGDVTQTVYTLYKNAAGTVALGVSALNGVAGIAVGTGDTVLGAYLDLATVGNVIITYDKGGGGDNDLLTWDGSNFLSAGMLTTTGGNVAYTSSTFSVYDDLITFTCSNAAAVDSIMVYGTDVGGNVLTEYLTMVAGTATTTKPFQTIVHVGCSGTAQTETFIITSDDWAAAGTLTEGMDFTITLSNAGTKIWGFTGAAYCRTIELGNSEVSGNLSISLIHDEEIQELIQGLFGRIIFTIATGETVQIEDLTYDLDSIDFSEAAPLVQKIPWTADTYSFP